MPDPSQAALSAQAARLQQPALWHGLIQTEQWTVEGFRLSATAGSPQLQVLVLPGNPGSAAFYVPYLQSLHAAWQGQAEVMAISHLGHGALSPHSSQLYSLREQIRHHAAFLRTHLLVAGRPPLALIGHSIGAYMALHAAHLLEQEHEQGGAKAGVGDLPRICKVVSIFPFLTVDPGSPKQRTIRFCTHFPVTMGWVAALLGLLPLGLQRLIVQFGTNGGMDLHAVEASLGLLNARVAANAFFMGGTEFTDLAAPADWWLLERFGPRVAVLCAPEDIWFPRWKWEQMWLKVPGIEAYMEEVQRHDYCVSVAPSDRLARRTADIIKRAQAKHSAT